MHKPGALVAAMLALTSVGCASFTSFQTARSMEAGTTSLDVSIASVALGGGEEAAARLRGGLGRGVEAGVQMGANSGGFGSVLMSADVKYQFLKESEEIPVAAAVDVGAGTGLFSNFYFVQAMVSKRFDWLEPYFSYRFQVIDIDLDLNDPDDRDDLMDSILEEIIEEADETNIQMHHFFFGARLNLGGNFYIVPEFSILAGDASGLGSVGIDAGVEWKW